VGPPKLRLVFDPNPKSDWAVEVTKDVKLLLSPAADTSVAALPSLDPKLDKLLLEENTPSVLEVFEEAFELPTLVLIEGDEVKLAELTDDDTLPRAAPDPKLANRFFDETGSTGLTFPTLASTLTTFSELGTIEAAVFTKEDPNVMTGSPKGALTVSLLSSVFSGELLAGEIGSYTGAFTGVEEAVTSTDIDPEVYVEDCLETDTGWKDDLFEVCELGIVWKADLSEGSPDESDKEPEAMIFV